MGYKIIQIKLPTGYSESDLKQRIGKELRIKEFTFQVETKSLDAPVSYTHLTLPTIYSV